MSISKSVFASSAGVSRTRTSTSGQCSANASSRVRQSRGLTISDGSFAAATHFR
jgi:hypothetical protein